MHDTHHVQVTVRLPYLDTNTLTRRLNAQRIDEYAGSFQE